MLPDMNALIEKIRLRLTQGAPELLPLYAVMSQEARFGRDWIDVDLKSLASGAKILEVGGGIFLLSCQLAHEGFDVTTVEPTSQGFGEFERLREKVIETARETGPLPKIAACPIEEFRSDEKFDFAFSVNVMEHVDDVNAAIGRVSEALHDKASYRFICPNYLFPHEPHFNIPTFFTKALTEKLMHSRIFGSKRMADPAGVWKSLNWITVSKVRRRAANDHHLSLSFRKDTLVWMLERALSDAEFAKRRAGWMLSFIRTAMKLKVLNLAKFIPTALQPVMDCRLTRKA